ncbi:hypothetical protein Pmani_032108 [Petrolisthes manimaculis]|uniref:Uncharacterized protein n=1 Tax=Petrolisthes manimaculis TaxID=1843537 RepID=A0AAE1NUC1_9EUCA|nr:hypothetical protein Pmani_032108 [Petrolisthes manimaculis]
MTARVGVHESVIGGLKLNTWQVDTRHPPEHTGTNGSSILARRDFGASLYPVKDAMVSASHFPLAVYCLVASPTAHQ